MLELNVNPNFKRSEVVPVPAQTLKLKSKKVFMNELELVSDKANVEILTKIDDFNVKEMKKPKTKLTQLVPYKFIYANYMMGYSLEENKLLIDNKFNLSFELNSIKMIIHRMGLLVKGSENKEDNFVMDSVMAKNKINCPNRDINEKQIISLKRSRDKQKLNYQLSQQEQGKEVQKIIHTKKHSGFGIRQMIDK